MEGDASDAEMFAEQFIGELVDWDAPQEMTSAASLSVTTARALQPFGLISAVQVYR